MLGLLVKPGTPEQRKAGTSEQCYSGTRNTGTLKILNLLKIRKKCPRGGEVTGIGTLRPTTPRAGRRAFGTKELITQNKS